MSENLSPRSLRFNKGVLTLDGIQPDASPVPKHEWVYSPAQNQWVADACLYPSVCSNTEKQFSADEVGNWQELPDLGESNLPTLRPDQNEAVSAWLNIGRRGMIYMPTGTGKTEVALKLIKELGVSTLIVSPFRDLMHQWHRRIKHGLGYDAGIIGDNHRTVKPLSVTTYRSASMRRGCRRPGIVWD